MSQRRPRDVLTLSLHPLRQGPGEQPDEVALVSHSVLTEEEYKACAVPSVWEPFV